MGLKTGIKQTIDDAIDLGKSAIGIFNGNFESIGQMQKAIQNGGLIDGISNLLDFTVDNVKKAGLIDNNISKTIKQGKNIILNNLENNITQSFNNQYQVLENTNKYIKNWKEYFKNNNFEGMDKEFNKIKQQMKSIAPIEKTINDIRSIQVLHNLIKNNGKNFNLSTEQLELVEKLK